MKKKRSYEKCNEFKNWLYKREMFHTMSLTGSNEHRKYAEFYRLMMMTLAYYEYNHSLMELKEFLSNGYTNPFKYGKYF
jgi:hypothetical protein